MRAKLLTVVCSAVFVALVHASSRDVEPSQSQAPQPVQGQGGGQGRGQAPSPYEPVPEVAAIVGRLDLSKYKATIQGLTQFGDRREGTQRNRDAVAWIEAQLKSYGCTNTERHRYELPPPNPARGQRGGGRGQARGRGEPPRVPAGTPDDPVRRGAGGRAFGGPTGVNTDPQRQPNVKLRELNMEPVLPGPRENIYCTKIGATVPGEMYIIGAHLDGVGYGEAANDDGSGTALVMEVARVLSSPDVTTDRSIRFVLWNSEELGEVGSKAYVADREGLQGREDPLGSGRYPEPKWVGVIQHDMMMWDHGMPAADGKVSPWQRPEADVNIEFQEDSKRVAESQKLAWFVKDANVRYATDYPAHVGNHMQSTDSFSFKDITASVSLRENERRDIIGFGWSPHWHQPTDVFATYTDKDFRLGLNAAQTTLAAVVQLAGARIR